jgi:hypothetical protein
MAAVDGDVEGDEDGAVLGDAAVVGDAVGDATLGAAVDDEPVEQAAIASASAGTRRVMDRFMADGFPSGSGRGGPGRSVGPKYLALNPIRQVPPQLDDRLLDRGIGGKVSRMDDDLVSRGPGYDLPATIALRHRGRALVVSAAHDAQVPASDGDRIYEALGSDPTRKTRVTIADANHVYKAETRAPSTMSPADIAAGHADDDHPLAEGLVDAIVDFVTSA